MLKYSLKICKNQLNNQGDNRGKENFLHLLRRFIQGGIKLDSKLLMRELPEEERPRERLFRFGVKNLTNSELLAILIGSGTKDSSAIILANKLLSLNEEGISYLSQCDTTEFSRIKGIGNAKACLLVAAMELGKRISVRPKEKRINVGSPKEVSKLFMEEMRYYKKEYFKVLLLNTKNELIMTEEVSVGTLNTAIVHPREVFNKAIQKSASSLILIHNHPSGNPTPSREDIDLTNRLVESGKIIGIEVLDHIIIGDGEYLSFKEKQLF
jgi:DNA repair protein RadC